MCRLIFKVVQLRFLTLATLALLMLSGCLNRNTSEMISTKHLALAELNPQLRFEQEVMIVRLTQVLQEAKLTPNERADLYFERGVIYDSLGLWSLARHDFMQSISLNQKMAAAYNYIGLYLLLEDDYDSALDAFNAVLELDPHYNYTFLNRGLAFYYSGRYSEAERDLLRFYQEDKADPYRVLWLYFNELEFKPNEAKANLITRSKALSAHYWGTNIIHYFLGELTLAQLRDIMDKEAQPNTASYAEILTETYFYLAKQQLKLNKTDEAISAFRLSLANQVFNFVEYRFALFELSQLRAMENQTYPVVGIN
ncbi:lipoprotein NlpI-like protein [[Haemophilus] ducreyi]|uniref:Lipoprotein NlpI n=2 Tax=Haemophilus ducreyi TaxID=730 RepID=Q7VL90_HAEDU|nr:lipoprotein NlpI [[Haemophilus] ducreyi]AAP96369.1 lipoprotein NlpI-like protein [[Haemophilus] ducreyi 35000HP]AKO31256.1 lipoprotein NlpI-like protein [[Haemophilus] ducreyi]AKO32703.1 lipoprotein NlpI-like protein [[Haemophilus] ducreyi]AKO34153.1 lipoprotein NlpI-like protein [[Haemophilus] ducreyi]AKO35596.1 lipoprotein NlpI-like protein [[Haemophilus] ducreyi]